MSLVVFSSLQYPTLASLPVSQTPGLHSGVTVNMPATKDGGWACPACLQLGLLFMPQRGGGLFLPQCAARGLQGGGAT